MLRFGRSRGLGMTIGGFTLLETAVTILVLGVVAMLGYEAFTTLIDRRTQIRAAMAETERAAALRATLEEWFDRGALGPRDRDRATLAPPDIGSQSHDVLAFTTRAQNPSTSWITTMILFIDNDPSTPEQGLTVQYLPFSSGEIMPSLGLTTMYSMKTQDEQLRQLGQSPMARELDRQVTGLRVEYLDRRTHRWFRARNSSTIEMVIATRVTLEGTPSAPLPPLLQLPFLITMHESWMRRSEP